METRSKRRKVEDPPPPNNFSKEHALVEVGANYHHHPLMNDLILENMLRYCPSSELCQARLVCRQWYETSLPVLKKSGPPIVLQDGQVQDHIDPGLQVVERKLLKNFLDEMHPKDPPPPGGISGIQQYNKFNLHLSSIPHSPLLSSFWKAVGPWVTQLTMDFRCSTLTFFENVMLCNWTPNVERLHAKVTPVVDFYRNGSIMSMSSAAGRPSKLKYLQVAFDTFCVFRTATFPIDWKALFDYHSKLEHFIFSQPLHPMLDQVQPIILAIGQIRTESNYSKLSLKTLDLFGDRERNFKEHNFSVVMDIPSALDELNLLSAAAIESLVYARLPLESLKLCHQADMPDQVVHRLISAYGSALKSLSLCKATLVQEGFPFALMTSLRSLTLSGAPLKDLAFLRQLPTLRVLHLWTKSATPAAAGSENLIKATNVEEEGGGVEFTSSLVQFCCNYPEEFTPGDITRLKTLMPNLTHLELVLYNRTFRRVCKLWPDLEHLSVFLEHVGDMGIVGRNSSAKPNITCLQNLRTFTIDNLHHPLGLGLPGHQAATLLTKRSVEQGFLKLPRLQKLEFRVTQMDPELKCMLKSKIMPLVEVHIQIPETSLQLNRRTLRTLISMVGLLGVVLGEP